ncbi:uncharacterized protein LOC121253433 [Juglans microcarpa x Juglans regia]|uniref:uncharacterized protein LOC121253433 n=1 Tax=Juglans microcarpa x Juglans regia TaxID=2249226 RepID=UPI001B7DF9B6|nr:uncharacterized protein LOC121253433 [Juglans microcarpa x Juglans regia]
MKELSRMLSVVVSNGFMAGFSVDDPNRGLTLVSHLLFVDDTLIFYEAEQDQLRALKELLLCFEATLGLRVNFDKSELVPDGNISTTRQLASTLGCKVTSLPMAYLGLPLGAVSRALSIWDAVIEKIERRLAWWKRLYLSKGGRVNLIKSTLSNLPTYFLSVFPIPACVAARIKKLYRDFLWSGMEDDFKFHLVSWDKVCKPILSGGLGIKNLKTFNRALLGKWLWRYIWNRKLSGN